MGKQYHANFSFSNIYFVCIEAGEKKMQNKNALRYMEYGQQNDDKTEKYTQINCLSNYYKRFGRWQVGQSQRQ